MDKSSIVIIIIIIITSMPQAERNRFQEVLPTSSILGFKRLIYNVMRSINLRFTYLLPWHVFTLSLVHCCAAAGS